jgi:hypothetical protein
MNPSASKGPAGSFPPAAASQRRFAFCGRVSTEDQQDPEASRNWQLARARGLIEPVGGVVVAEFFDIGLSRSIPWKRRPQAARLLEELKRPGNWIGPRLRAGGPGLQSVWCVGVSVLVSGMGL